MMLIVTAENRALFADDVMEMHRQRKRVFVDRNGWNVPVVRDMEIDEYDHDETVYLIGKDAFQMRVSVSVRLLPTIRAHLMSDLFRDACGGEPLRGPRVWEVSRFCISPEIRSQRTRISLVRNTVCGVIETALLFGIERVTFVANAWLLPLIIDCGWNAEPLGPPLQYGDEEITAIAATTNLHTLCAVRQRFGISDPVTRYVTTAAPAAWPRISIERTAHDQRWH